MQQRWLIAGLLLVGLSFGCSQPIPDFQQPIGEVLNDNGSPARAVPLGIRLQSRTIPVAKEGWGPLEPTPNGIHHIFVVLRSPRAEIPALNLVSRIQTDTFVARITEQTLRRWQQRENRPEAVHWMGPIIPQDRVNRRLWPELTEPSGQSQSILIRPFRDVDFHAFQQAIQPLFSSLHCDLIVGSCSGETDGAGIQSLARVDSTAWITPRRKAHTPTLQGLTESMGVDIVRPGSDTDPPQYPLSGEGVVAAIWDPDAPDEAHPDLQGRIIRAPASANGYSHATQVGGALGGSGAASNGVYPGWEPYKWTGVAPHVQFVFYLSSGEGEMTFGPQFEEAVNIHGADLASFSFKDEIGGVYGDTEVSLDAIVAGQTPDLDHSLPLFWATANDAQSAGYSSLANFTAAKNVIAVGATNANDGSLANFSSMGPTADGRLKPDVLAPGCYDTLQATVAVDHIRLLSGGNLIQEWNFNTDGDTEGWTAANQLTPLTVSNGMLHTTMLGRDPHMHSPSFSINTGNVDTVEILYATSGGSMGQFFWKTDTGDWHEDRHVDFFIPGDGEQTATSLSTGELPDWNGTLMQIRLDPAMLGVTVPEEGQTYTADCGTSISAPAAAGVGALMLEAFRNANGEGMANPPPAAYRAVLTATAADVIGPSSGNNPDTGAPTMATPGPDFASGFGLIQAPAAVMAFSAGPDELPRFEVEKLGFGLVTSTRHLNIPQGTENIRVVVAWDDWPGEPMAEAMLQTDLDLLLRDPTGGEYLPWVLDPDEPTATATKGANHRDNLEMVEVDLPISGVWEVEVKVFDNFGPGEEISIVAVVDDMPQAFYIAGSSVEDEPDVIGDAQAEDTWSEATDAVSDVETQGETTGGNEPIDSWAEDDIPPPTPDVEADGSTPPSPPENPVNDAPDDTAGGCDASGNGTTPNLVLGFLLLAGVVFVRRSYRA